MISLRLQDDLKQDEGFRLLAYDDKTGKNIYQFSILQGHPTIGYGRCLDTKGITKPEAEMLFQNDVASVLETLSRFPWFMRLNEARKYIVVNMAFNMGVGGVEGFRGMIAGLEAGDYQRASAEMLDSLWARQLPKRSIKLAKIMQAGIVE